MKEQITEQIEYSCQMLDGGGIWRKCAMAPPADVKVPCDNQLDAKACIEKWDPWGKFKWRIWRTSVKTTRSIVRTLDRHGPKRAGSL